MKTIMKLIAVMFFDWILLAVFLFLSTIYFIFIPEHWGKLVLITLVFIGWFGGGMLENLMSPKRK
ncbi:hypothetical protein D0N50_00615 [Erwinia billingiae]|uniref:hypothetical protein n=1 Tax=Erwinia billingiae TaxID=182337 RepID=UPI001244D81C|nr:hypothetical protein [Erwinia billingiae]QEW30280.1 hypothetical protein D0N50_00615 [Erwinia billingiae]